MEHGKEASFSYQKNNGTSSYHAKSYDFVAGEHDNPFCFLYSRLGVSGILTVSIVWSKKRLALGVQRFTKMNQNSC